MILYAVRDHLFIIHYVDTCYTHAYGRTPDDGINGILLNS